jgi:hypothetical protein
MRSDTDVTYFTICNDPYFTGTVALLNSLRLTGNQGSLVVLDTGLRSSQRSRLAKHVRIVELTGDLSRPWLFKAFPRLFDPSGVIVVIDSDMIVLRSLSNLIEHAWSGKICVFPDPLSQTGRWFREWETAFELRVPLRQGDAYVNAGFIALSVDYWPDFLSRFAEALERMPQQSIWTGERQDAPFWGADQDALNALLMSEVPSGSVELLPQNQQVHPDSLARVEVVDDGSLECLVGGERPAILHYSMAPKAWSPRGWRRVRSDAYVRLLSRVVCGTDVVLRLEPEELPVWLRPTVAGKVALAALDRIHAAGGWVWRRLRSG